MIQTGISTIDTMVRTSLTARADAPQNSIARGQKIPIFSASGESL